MELFRAIWFHNVLHSVNDELRKEALNRASRGMKRWWMRKSCRELCEAIMMDVALNGGDKFLDSSKKYSAKNGGRFNMDRSHGVTYCCTDPILSVMEVSYHVFQSTQESLRKLGKKRDDLSSAVNVNIPSDLDFLVGVFGIRVEDDYGNFSLDIRDSQNMTKCLKKCGFERYLSTEIGERVVDLVLGNDTTVAQVLGAYAHSKPKTNFILSKSARLLDDDAHNVIVLDKKSTSLQMSGNYGLIRVRVLPDKDKKNTFVFDLRDFLSGKSLLKCKLPKVNQRCGRSDSCMSCFPGTSKEFVDRVESIRKVVTQRYEIIG